MPFEISNRIAPSIPLFHFICRELLQKMRSYHHHSYQAHLHDISQRAIMSLAFLATIIGQLGKQQPFPTLVALATKKTGSNSSFSVPPFSIYNISLSLSLSHCDIFLFPSQRTRCVPPSPSFPPPSCSYAPSPAPSPGYHEPPPAPPSSHRPTSNALK